MQGMKKRILLINDDGIEAPGLWHLHGLLEKDYEVAVVAPEAQRSGAAASMTYTVPLHVEKVRDLVWKISGTPADCVKIAVTRLLDWEPDMVISGVNDEINAGRTAIFSGTVGGAIEASLRGMRAVAFSTPGVATRAMLEKHIPRIVHKLMGIVKAGTVFNVNFPEIEPLGVRMARQGMGYTLEDPERLDDVEGRHVYDMTGLWKSFDEHHLSDVTLLKKGYIAIAPLHVSELTDHGIIDEFSHLFDQ